MMTVTKLTLIMATVFLLCVVGCSQASDTQSRTVLRVVEVKSRMVNDYGGTNYLIHTLVKIMNPTGEDFSVTVQLLDADGLALDAYTFSSNGSSSERFTQRGDTSIFNGEGMLAPEAYSQFVSTTATIGKSKY